MSITLCEDCIRSLMYNLSTLDIKLLSAMEKNNVNSPLQSMDKVALINLVKELTIYKFNLTIERLLTIGAVNENKKGITKYYISPIGNTIIKLYKQDLIKANNLSSKVKKS